MVAHPDRAASNTTDAGTLRVHIDRVAEDPGTVLAGDFEAVDAGPLDRPLDVGADGGAQGLAIMEQPERPALGELDHRREPRLPGDAVPHQRPPLGVVAASG